MRLSAPDTELTMPAIQPESQPRSSTLLGEIFRTLLFALIVFLSARLLVLPYQVDGRSMAPNLQDRERVLVNRAVYIHLNLDSLVGWIPGLGGVADDSYYPFHSPQPGDIVVLNPPQYSTEPYIKRTIATAGDVVDIRDGKVFVNGVELDEPYVDGVDTYCYSSEFCTGYVVPLDTIYVLGDNRPDSFDSRSFGAVPLDNIIGKAWFSNWPAETFGPIG